ncbi:hypothetical protein ACEWY4_008434 [Coilia grayii]|uniref:Uncharacterized protein n=1 Tax=Coilia grayii TaxID=363190 RepID=A0ABD1KB90_9TELE
MYTHFLITQTSTKNYKYTGSKERDEKMIFKLGKLAFQQLEKGNRIFYEEDLRECGIDVTEASVYSGVCSQIFREESGLFQGKVFSFVHLSIEEFLAALYVFLCFSNRERNLPEQQQTSLVSALARALRRVLPFGTQHSAPSDQQQTSPLSALLTAATLQDLYETAVNLNLCDEHLDLFLRFLLGLSLESNQSLLRHLLPQTSSQSQSSEQTVQLVKQKIRDQNTLNKTINLFYCLNELNQHAVVEHTDRSSGTLSVVMLLPGEWKTKQFQLKISEKQLDEIDLQKYIKTPEMDQTESLSPDEVLQKLMPIVSTSISARMDSCILTEKSCSYLASAMTSHFSNLRQLKLSYNRLRDSGVELLCSALSDLNCKLEELQLVFCQLTEKSCSYLASVLTSHSSSLKQLNLSDNNLQDSGVELLCSALCHSNCKLEELQLWSCNLTEKSCSYLASALTSCSSSLTQLNLSNNMLFESGVTMLISALSHYNCKLETLELFYCSLSESICSCLLSALSSGFSSLRQLNLRGIHLSEHHLQQLSALVQDPHSTLQTLQLDDRTIIKELSAAAASTSSSHSSDAAELHLTHNTQQHPGAQLLSLHTARGCISCDAVPDTSHWVLVEPEVSTEKTVSAYSLSSPAGSYECSVSGLRWSCAGPVTLQYRFMDWYVFAEELAHMQCSPAGPLMDIELVSGELEEIQLPHFLCLGGCEASVCDAVRVLHGRDSGVCVEVCELMQHHAKLLQPSLSPLGLLYYVTSLLFPVRVHAKVLVYQCTASPLEFRSYLLPEDARLKQEVQRDEEKLGGVWKASSHPPSPLQIHDFYSLDTDCASDIYPEQLMLRYSSDTPNFFKVKLPHAACGSFHMQLYSAAASRGQPDSRGQPVWREEFQSGLDRQTEGHPQQPSRTPVQVGRQMAAAFVDERRPELIGRVTEVMPIAEQLLSQRVFGQETYANIHAAATSQEKMRALYEGLRSAGDQGKLAFYRILQAQQPLLVEDLWTARAQDSPT